MTYELCAECSAIFDQKQHDPCDPPSLFTESRPQVTFFVYFPGVKKVLKGKHFPDVEEVKQTMANALKGIKIDEFKNCFQQWKIHLGYITSDGEYEFKCVRINTPLFINRFCFLLVPPVHV